MKQYLTAVEVAELLQVNIKTVYQWSKDGTLPAIRFGCGKKKLVRFDPDVLVSFLKAPRDGRMLFDKKEENSHVSQRDTAWKVQNQPLVDRERTAKKARAYGLRLAPGRQKVRERPEERNEGG